MQEAWLLWEAVSLRGELERVELGELRLEVDFGGEGWGRWECFQRLEVWRPHPLLTKPHLWTSKPERASISFLYPFLIYIEKTSTVRIRHKLSDK